MDVFMPSFKGTIASDNGEPVAVEGFWQQAPTPESYEEREGIKFMKAPADTSLDFGEQGTTYRPLSGPIPRRLNPRMLC